MENEGIAVPAEKTGPVIDENVFVEMMLAGEDDEDGTPQPEKEAPNGVQEEVEGDAEAGVDAPKEKASGGEDKQDDEVLEFADDVIPGLKGIDVGKLSPESQIALAKYHDDTTLKSGEMNRLRAEIEVLKSDPVVAHRIAAMNDPRSIDFSVNDSEVESIINADTVAGAKLALQKIIDAKGLKSANIHIEAMDVQRKRENAERRGKENLLAAVNLNSDLAIKETNLEKIVPGHPEWSQYQKGLERALRYCVDRGLKWNHLAEMTPQEIYAPVAVKENWAVAFNTADRDKKITMSAHRQALKSFLKVGGRSADASGQNMTPEGRTPGTQRKGELVVDGIDLVKLASDDDYHEQVLVRNQTPAWTNKVAAWTARGEEALRADKARSRSIKV